MALTANSNFYFKMKALNFQTWRRFRREDLEGKIHFEHFPSLSFGPSQCHKSVNIGSNSTSRDSFVICRSRALIWHQDWWYFWMNCWRNQLLKFWPSLYLTYCTYAWDTAETVERRLRHRILIILIVVELLLLEKVHDSCLAFSPDLISLGFSATGAST